MRLEHKSGGGKGILGLLLGFSVPTWVNFVINTLAAIILTRVFLPEEYGTITIFISTTEFGMSLLCLGMDSGCLRFYNSPPNKETSRVFLAKIIVLCSAIVVFCGLVICFFCPNWFAATVFGFENKLVTVCLLINVFSSTVLRFFGISYRMQMKSKEYGIQTILVNTIRKIGYLLGVLISPDAVTAICVQVLLLFATVIVYAIRQHKDVVPRRDEVTGYLKPNTFFTGYADFLKFSFFNAPRYLMTYANNMTGLQIVRVVCGDHAVGIYSTTSYFTSALAVMRGGFGTFWAPYMYQNYKEKQQQIQRVHSIWMLFSAVCFTGLIVFKDVIYLLVGTEFASGRDIVSFVLLGSLLQACMETTVYGIYIENKAHIGTIVQAVHLASFIVFSYLFATQLGVLGVAVGNLLSNLIYFLLATYYGQKYYKSIDKLWKTLAVVILLVLDCVVFLLLDKLVATVTVLLILALAFMIYLEETKYCIRFALGYLRKSRNKADT